MNTRITLGRKRNNAFELIDKKRGASAPSLTTNPFTKDYILLEFFIWSSSEKPELFGNC